MAEGLRLGEFLAALSLATDLGMGQPLEQTLRTCLIAVALGQRLGLGPDDLSDVYYVALLRFLGCTADAHEFAEMVGGDDIAVRAAIAPVLGGPPAEFVSGVMLKIGAGHNPLVRAGLVLGMMRVGQERGREGVRAHCELGEHLARRLGMTAGVRAGLQAAFEHWNGQGLPNGWTGEQIALPARIVFVARADIPPGARVLAAADAYQAMTQPRAYRPALEPERAADQLETMASSSRLDRDAVSSVLAAAGHTVRRARTTWPAGLTDREVEVLRVICRGGIKKQVASMLSISPSTVDHHLRHIYDKAGVQSRAGATLFALEHDLLK